MWNTSKQMNLVGHNEMHELQLIKLKLVDKF